MTTSRLACDRELLRQSLDDRLALQADQGPPEARNDQLAHFFHRHLADILMAVGRPDLAVYHYQTALEKTAIEGYAKASGGS